MIWLNPWAWIGTIAIAIPIAVHLLGRRHPRRQVFPTLRFLSISRLVPARRTRPVDLALLAIRIGIVLLAVAALAQPVFLSRANATEAGRAIVRAIVVDTSASMSRPTPGGARAVDTARIEAARFAQEATRSTVIESADPRFARLRGGRVARDECDPARARRHLGFSVGHDRRRRPRRGAAGDWRPAGSHRREGGIRSGPSAVADRSARRRCTGNCVGRRVRRG